MTKAQIRKNAFLKSIPIMCSYIFVSMAYGIMMENAGFGWYYSLFVSLAFPKGIAAVRVLKMLCDKRKSGIFGWISFDQMNRLCYDMYRYTRIFI